MKVHKFYALTIYSIIFIVLDFIVHVFFAININVGFFLARMDRKALLKRLYEKNLAETKQKIKESVKADHLIIQAINAISELSRNANVTARRLKEWYALYSPEIVANYEDNEQFVDEILRKPKKKILGELGLKNNQNMGADLLKEDVDQILTLSEALKRLYHEIENLKLYLETTFKRACPNTHELSGSLVGAQLLEHAGSLKNLASMTASKIQLLGAEKALFRHLRTGAKSPKHGLLIQHNYVAGSKNKGKAARHLADKISIAARVDYFKGEFIGDRLKSELMDKKD